MSNPILMDKRNINSEDSGFTLIELTLAMFGVSLVMIMMIAMMGAVTRVDNDTTNEKEVLDNLRFTRLLLEREIREADVIFADSNDVRLHLWTDADGDDALDAEENVVWTLSYEAAGAFRMQRRDGAGNSLLDDSLLVLPGDGSPVFGYDVAPPDTGRVTLTLESEFRLGNSTAARNLISQVSLRNSKNAGGTGP